MTDAQLLTLALAVIIPVSAVIYSNSRISDAKDALRAETKALSAELKGEIAGLGKDLKAGFERIEMLLKAHELEHHK